MEEAEITVSNGANTEAEDGEPTVTTGFLGRGKLIPSNTSGPPDSFMEGKHRPNNEEAGYSKECECIVHCKGCTGPAP